MKKFFESRIKGLIWFVVIYALLRTLFSNPDTAIQGKDMFAIILGSISFVWLLFPTIMGGANLPLSLSFFSLSGYSLFSWTKFDSGIFSISWFQDLNDDKIALLVALLIFVVSFIIMITDCIVLWKSEKKQVWTWSPVWLIFISFLIIAGDYFLPGIIPW